jgi:hypothetical protein
MSYARRVGNDATPAGGDLQRGAPRVYIVLEELISNRG